ncbi:Npun_F0813 family protein [Chamaesiphon polymorphus]|uniref:Uncharacterized protein n=1 Tax=Chamaesiphon polymorphus CCALA 037 TaxID=2107692 RepID=A0A2T1FZ31_9CYAN|nr:hypothetical protein [Chamaesiphon polymorphus]PSB50232.1 hypothetical protein C7B77_23020 [Chamaesiphon polymorphus CCALA 037]
MSIIAPQSVKIEICTLGEDRRSQLRLNYGGQIYNLVQAFATHHRERAERQLQQLITRDREDNDLVTSDRYLLVPEVGYYSLWELTKATQPTVAVVRQVEGDVQLASPLQQASIWLLQELWLQLTDLLGAKQLTTFAETLVKVTPQLQSWVDLDRLLALDPLMRVKIGSWSDADFINLNRQIYHLTQKKIGAEFTTKLTIEIVRAMPDDLSATIAEILTI